MDDWEKFNERSLPEKEDLYSHLNMQFITDSDYTYTKAYYHFYIQSDSLLLANFWDFKNIRSMYFEIYELYPAHFLSVPGLTWQAALKKTKLKLDLLININMLLMI